MTYQPWNTKNVHSQVKRVMFYIAYKPWQSASQIAKALKLKPAVVSGTLKVLTDEKALERKPGCGPRGGFGYALNPEVFREVVPKSEPGLTWFDRLDTLVDELTKS